MSILDLLARSEHELGLTEIHQEVGVPKATAFMILNVLESHRMVKKNEQNRYTIGVRLYELGVTYVSKLDLVKIGRPFISELLRLTNLTSHLGALYDQRVIFIDKIEPKSMIRFSTFPGLRSDIHMCSLGKAMAAFLPDAEVDAIVAAVGLGAYTIHTITDAAALRTELAVVRERGFSIEDEEGELGVRCIGAPIFDNSLRVVAAASVTGLLAAIPDTRYSELGVEVTRIADDITRALGGDPAEARRIHRLQSTPNPMGVA